MNDWRTALRDGDPAAHAQLPNDAAQAMRRAVLAQVASRGSAGRASPADNVKASIASSGSFPRLLFAHTSTATNRTSARGLFNAS